VYLPRKDGNRMMNQTLLEELKQYIAENWEEEIFLLDEKEPPHPFLKPKPHMLFGAYAKQSIQKNEVQLEANTCESEIPMELNESFSEMLLRKIDESGKKDSEIYKLANVSKQVFSNIRSSYHYVPSKTTALAFAVALKMNLEETKELLERAGYALSHSYKLDVIVEYFIKNQKYDIDEINAALYEFDQKLLGGK
ncbi:MAG: RNase III inhibitor, partial [Lachnospiraceae bacterium]|nr:RNase III inhibitor [Lachnospiraceae bacterium]